MGFRLFLCFSFMAALFINGVIPGQPDIQDKNEKRQILRKRLQKTKESVDELAVELAKTHLISLIVNKHHKIEEVTKSIKTLDRDRCGDLKSVGKPVTHNTQLFTQGTWMKDPLGLMGTETIFVMNGFHGNKLVEYKNMNYFKGGVPRKTYTLPYPFDGTGAVVYGPFLYYNRANTNQLLKYNLKTQRVEASITIRYYTPRRNYYQWNGYSGMDIAVDEQGLWVISGSTHNGYRPYISKIDVKYNRVTHIWTLSGVESMKSMGNSFMACGVFYAVDRFNHRTTTINYAYDTKTGRRWNPGLTFVNQYGYNSMIAYNHRERMLYSWDNKRQVTYSLNFKS